MKVHQSTSHSPVTENTSFTGKITRGITKVPLIPIRHRQFGPLMLKRRWRLVLIWAVLFAACWYLLASNLSVGWNAFALSLMIPGAGFLNAGTIIGAILAVLSLLSLPAAMINWFACGNMLSVIVTWLGGAFLAGVYNTYWAVSPVAGVSEWTPYVTMAIVAAWAVGNRVNFYRGRSRAESHNEAIKTLNEPLLKIIPPVEAKPEMNEIQLAVARSFLEKGLQPDGQWDGFALDVEQWQLKATRYQLYNSIEKLAYITYQHTPAFTGYAREAMANLIQKNLDKRIWQFWFWENLWGNFDSNPDPIRKDNIMVTGWVGTYLGMFETLFQDRRFDQPGALNWRWNDTKQFKYNHTDLIKALEHNYGRYDFAWYPCEPNLIYSMCNVYGFNALQIYDRLRGTDYWDRIRDRAEKSFEEELMHPDGRTVCLVFNRVGLQAPMLSSVLGESSTLPGLMAMWPDKAERLWHVMKREFLHQKQNGHMEVKLLDFGWDRWDATAWAGNITVVRRAHEIRPRFSLLKAAIEMGDDNVASLLSDDIDQRFGEGTSIGLTLGHSKGNIHNMIVEGTPETWAKGPVLEQAEFPDVLVARAVNDGESLHLVLRPGDGAKLVSLGLGRLLPGQHYRVVGDVSESLMADALGRSSLVLLLDGRKEIRVMPVK